MREVFHETRPDIAARFSHIGGPTLTAQAAMRSSIASILVLFFTCFEHVHAKGTLSIQLLDYNNPTNQDSDGSCCDCCGAFGWCPADCENFFEIYIAAYPFTFYNFFANYYWKHWETYVLGDDSFYFPGFGKTIGPSLTNPLTYHFDSRWPGAFGIAMKVWDDDSGNFLGKGHNDDHIDTIYYNVANVSAQKNFGSAVVKSITLTGRRSSTRMLVRVYCDFNYYGTDCNTYCVGQDDSTRGHYSCDENSGTKVCLRGWRGQNCLTPICKTNCDPNHGSCTTPDTCQCDSGWQPPLCKFCQKKQGCTANGYCVVGNDCVCRPDWTGVNCEQDLNKCRDPVCQHGGTCINTGPDQYRCNCAPGYEGHNCQKGNNRSTTSSNRSQK